MQITYLIDIKYLIDKIDKSFYKERSKLSSKETTQYKMGKESLQRKCM